MTYQRKGTKFPPDDYLIWLKLFIRIKINQSPQDAWKFIYTHGGMKNVNFGRFTFSCENKSIYTFFFATVQMKRIKPTLLRDLVFILCFLILMIFLKKYSRLPGSHYILRDESKFIGYPGRDRRLFSKKWGVKRFFRVKKAGEDFISKKIRGGRRLFNYKFWESFWKSMLGQVTCVCSLAYDTCIHKVVFVTDSTEPN